MQIRLVQLHTMTFGAMLMKRVRPCITYFHKKNYPINFNVKMSIFWKYLKCETGRILQQKFAEFFSFLTFQTWPRKFHTFKTFNNDHMSRNKSMIFVSKTNTSGTQPNLVNCKKISTCNWFSCSSKQKSIKIHKFHLACLILNIFLLNFKHQVKMISSYHGEISYEIL